MAGTTPDPTPIRRFINLPNLAVYLAHRGMHCPNALPANCGWIATHNVQVQTRRGSAAIPCGPGGTILDYVPFYFGTHTPMMLNLHTDRVVGYNHDQRELIYLVSTAQAVQQAAHGFVFSDRHGLLALAEWRDDLADLSIVDWSAVKSRYWGSRMIQPENFRS